MAELSRVHTPSYIRQIKEMCESIPEDSIGKLDCDTVISNYSFKAAKHAVGAVFAAVDMIMDKKVN